MHLDEIIILGAGGHARVLIDCIKAINRYKIAGILDLVLEKGNVFDGVPVLGGDDKLAGLTEDDINLACIGIGGIKTNEKRKRIFEEAKKSGFSVPVLVHPRAIISKSDVEISEGVQVMAGAIIQVGSKIRENSIINTGAIVEHDSKIGKHVHVCPGAVISGMCVVEDGAFIGAGSTIIQGIKIGRDAVVAAGSAVVNDVPDGVIVKGVPAAVR